MPEWKNMLTEWPARQQWTSYMNISGSSQPEQEDSIFNLSRWDRLIIFFACLAMSAICFALAFFLIALKPRKFVLLWTLGSILFLASFAVLYGPTAYIRHLLSKERMPFTLVYGTSLIFTIFCAYFLKSLILSLISAIIQIVCLVAYLISYFPLGSQGVSLGLQVARNQIGVWTLV